MPHWHLPAGSSTTVVDSDEVLHRDVLPILQGSHAIGIDAEWPPEQTGRAPAAALLQLACWAPAGLSVLLLVRSFGF